MEGTFLIRLPSGDDLLDAITDAFRERSIRKAAFNVIGAVSAGVLGYYDHDARQYVSREFPGVREIVACTGNVSEKDGEIFVHAHAILSDGDFACVGGHVMPGTMVSVGELYGSAVPGDVPERVLDEATGLFLWPRS
jgi:predicted DNA-binding protein with PD1-like motif